MEEAFRLRDVELTDILHGVSWSVASGEAAVVIGPSGAGKSRLLRLLNRLQDATGGEIDIFGRPVADWDVRTLRRQVGLVGQRPTLSGGTVAENLRIPVELGVITEAEHADRLPHALAAARVPEDLLERATTLLSGGERQRVAIARALLLEPRALLLDEPTGALDGPTARGLLEAVDAWRKNTGGTLIVVTHRVADAEVLTGNLLVLMDGRVEDNASQRTKNFMAGVES